MKKRIAFALTFLLGAQVYTHAIDDDEDGISDVFEALHGGDLEPTSDADKDGATALAEYLMGGDPFVGDLFAIGALDLLEGTFTFPTGEGLLYQIETSNDQVAWSPLGGEIEGDGQPLSIAISSSDEGLDARRYFRIKALAPRDLDLDGLNTWEEKQLNTDITLADTDGDQVNDGDEWRKALNPLDKTADADADLLPDDWEIFFFGDTATVDGTGDQDGDGESDHAEFTAGTEALDRTSNSVGLLVYNKIDA